MLYITILIINRHKYEKEQEQGSLECVDLRIIQTQGGQKIKLNDVRIEL